MEPDKIKSVLIVDDDDVNIFLATRIIEHTETVDDIHAASNGQEALELIEKKRIYFPALVLLDLNMPVLDGFGFLDEFEKLKLNEKVFVAVVTSSSNEKDIDKSKNYDIIDYIVKPLTENKFEKVLKMAV